MRRITRVSSRLALAASLAALAACPGGASLPGKGNIPGAGASEVDPGACGGYAQVDAGKKIKAFLEATIELDKQVQKSEAYIKESCAMMAKDLGVSAEGDTKTVCTAVSDALKQNLQVGLKAGAELDIKYQPAVCEVNVDVAASAAASCEANASADVKVSCSGSCGGTCEGACDGTCEGGSGSGGECNGTCQGTCQGTCKGQCNGSADVDASAECRASASVKANASAECTPPDVDVNFEAGMVVDKTKIDADVAAIKTGLGRILSAQAFVKGPLKTAVLTWAKSARELKDSAGDIGKAFKDQALCISGQLGAAAAMIARIQSSLDIQVEMSVSVSASASAGGSAGGSASGG